MHKVTVYSTPTCHFCHLAKDYFKENNIAFVDYDVSVDMEKRQEMINISKQLGVPVIIVDNNAFVGFNKPKIAELLGLTN